MVIKKIVLKILLLIERLELEQEKITTRCGRIPL